MKKWKLTNINEKLNKSCIYDVQDAVFEAFIHSPDIRAKARNATPRDKADAIFPPYSPLCPQFREYLTNYRRNMQ